ncbi:MAG: AAA family ATPase [Candidatus Rokuibacteriota bacterium]
MRTPERPAPYRTLPAAHVAEMTAPLRWLLDGLFLAGGAGILGGAPKTGKSFFALELAVAVASGTPGAGTWAVATPGPVLLLAAEDPLAVFVQRLAALAAAREQTLATLPVDLIVEPLVRLPDGLERLAATVMQRRPVLLILDPLIRVHRADEHSAPEMAAILDGLRTLARDSGCAVLLVHHARKAPAGPSPGHGLRGSSDLHAFGDSNLYLRRLGVEGPLELRVEHRAAACPPPLRLRLRVTDDTARFVAEDAAPADPLRERLLTLVRRAPAPLSTATLRQTLGVRKQVLVNLLRTLVAEGRLGRAGREGWTAAPPTVPVPPSIAGNGNADAAPSH